MIKSPFPCKKVIVESIKIPHPQQGYAVIYPLRLIEKIVYPWKIERSILNLQLQALKSKIFLTKKHIFSHYLISHCSQMQEIHPNAFWLFSKMVDHFQTLLIIQTLSIRRLPCQNSLLCRRGSRILKWGGEFFPPQSEKSNITCISIFEG